MTPLEISDAITGTVAAVKALSGLGSLIGDARSADVLRERIAFLNDRMDFLKECVEHLQTENAHMEEANRALHDQITAMTRAEEFVEHRGALFKRKSGGGYHLAVYCPVCRHSASSTDQFLPYSCKRCKWATDFLGMEFDRIFKELAD